jgi:hypothetical protein
MDFLRFGFIKQMNKYLIGILSLSLILRLIGLGHGYPYVLNIDEPALVRSALGVRFDIWIDHFDWSHFNFYFHYIFFEIFIKLRAAIAFIGIKDYLQTLFPVLWDDPFIFYLLSRFLNSVLVVLSGIPLYLISRKYFEEKFALIGIIIYQTAPLSLSLSKYAVQEPALLFFLAWVLYFGVNAGLNLKWKDFISFSIFLGIATGIKYNAGIFGFIPLFVYLVFNKNLSNSIKDFSIKISTSLVLSIIAFSATTFSMFKYWNIFWSYEPGKGLLWQLFKNVSPLGLYDFSLKLLENFISFKDEIGPAGFILLLSGIVYGVIFFIKFNSENRADNLKLNFIFSIYALAYFIYTSRYGRSGGHYLIPIYIFIPFITSFFILFISEILNRKLYKIPIYIMYLGIILLITAGVLKSYISFIKPNTFSEAIKFAHTEAENNEFNVYIRGEDLENANAINNLGFKKYKDDSKIETNDLVLSESIIESEGISILKDYNLVKIYVKN